MNKKSDKEMLSELNKISGMLYETKKLMESVESATTSLRGYAIQEGSGNIRIDKEVKALATKSGTDVNEVINWFCNVRGIKMVDLVDYLYYASNKRGD